MLITEVIAPFLLTQEVFPNEFTSADGKSAHKDFGHFYGKLSQTQWSPCYENHLSDRTPIIIPFALKVPSHKLVATIIKE